MAILKKYGLLLLLLMAAGCKKDLDYMGLVYSEVNVNQRYKESMVWNQNRPREITVQDTTYQLIFTADPHIGGTKYLKRTMEIAKQSGAVGFVVAGDITTGRQDDFAVAASIFNADLPYEVALTVGNHDLFFGGWQRYYQYFGSSVYTLKVRSPAATDLYIFLDTGSGTLGPFQFEWLKNQLISRSQYRHVAVVTHLNFIRSCFTSTTNPLVQELSALLDLFARKSISLVIMGHDHCRYTERFGNTTYITLDDIVDYDSNPSYLMVTVGTKEMAYEFVDL
jgi:predicted phosphodiesterase